MASWGPQLSSRYTQPTFEYGAWRILLPPATRQQLRALSVVASAKENACLQDGHGKHALVRRNTRNPSLRAARQDPSNGRTTVVRFSSAGLRIP
ncbi:hypothetical protein CLIM01_02313 [Colletotrichum limetticola]|uniref:Uncharacterized protein n=1 Tax=Colletotrichum limetticola TaxID=1209924 RepID=A0ABQ9Q9D1_9PEZI|nr:hypothetical protein CLIM01_02313 [Colletotrichum limetticola]